MKYLFQQLAVLAIAALALLLVAAAGLFGLSLLFPDLCGNQVLAEAVSPDQRHKAVVFQRDCGAATGFSTQVSVLGAQAALPGDERGNAFAMDDPQHLLPAHAAGGPVVQVRWASAALLVVSHHAGGRVFLQAAQVREVRLAYQSL